MIIKSFVERSSAAALKRVREEMGGDAIVLETRQVLDSNKQRAVEITACLDNPSVAQSSVILADEAEQPTPSQPRETVAEAIQEAASEPETPGNDLERRLAALEEQLRTAQPAEVEEAIEDERQVALSDLRLALRDADFPEEFIAIVSKDASDLYKAGDEVADIASCTVVDHLARFMTPTLKFQPGDRVVLVGPAGAGKSTTLGKLAAQLIVREGRKVTLHTLDKQKVAAEQELINYARVMGAGLAIQEEEEKIEFAGDTIALIDTPALPTDDERFDALATDIAFTMLDMTSRYGGAVSVAQELGIKIGIVSSAAHGIDALQSPDPNRMVRNLLPQEADSE